MPVSLVDGARPSALARLLDPLDRTLHLPSISGAMLVAGFVALEVWSALSRPLTGGEFRFDATAYGTGAGLLITALSGAGWFAGRTPPASPPPPDSHNGG